MTITLPFGDLLTTDHPQATSVRPVLLISGHSYGPSDCIITDEGLVPARFYVAAQFKGLDTPALVKCFFNARE
jgi:hypothetical protein